MGVLTDLMGGGGPGGKITDWIKKRKNKREESQGSSGSSGGSDSHADIPEFKHGGKVRKTGLAKVHKGEEVLTAKQARKRRKGRGKSRG
jgi:hypothetical protein